MQITDYIRTLPGYVFSSHDGVYSLLEEKFKDRLDKFLDDFLVVQEKENYPYLPERLISDFPFVDHAPFKNEIFTRKQDLQILESLLLSWFHNNKTALEIGGWNGWLTRFLSKKKINTISVDIFSDSNNGLHSRKFHKNSNWLSLQADVCDTTIYAKKFDLIAFNHCLQFYPEHLLKSYEALLNPGGMLLILGASSHRNETAFRQKVIANKKYYINKYGFNLFFYDGPGYYSKSAIQQLSDRSYRFISYRFSLKSRIVKIIRGEKHGAFYYIKPE